MLLNASINAGSAIGSFTLCSSQRTVLQRVRHALQEMRLALVKSAKTISSQRLQDTHINVCVKVMQKFFAIDLR